MKKELLLLSLVACINVVSAKTQYVVHGPEVFSDTRNNFYEGNFFAIQPFESSGLRAYLVRNGRTYEYLGSSLANMVNSSIVLGPGPNSAPNNINMSDPTNYCATDTNGNQINVDINSWDTHYRSNGAWLRYVDKIVDSSNGDQSYIGFFHSETNACYYRNAVTADNLELQHVRMSIGLSFRSPSDSAFYPLQEPLFDLNYDPLIDNASEGEGIDPPQNPHYNLLKDTRGLAQVSLTRTDDYYYLFSGINNNRLSVSRFPHGSSNQSIPEVDWEALTHPNFSWEKYCNNSNGTAPVWVGKDDNTLGNPCKPGDYFGIPKQLQSQHSDLTTRLGRSPAYDLNGSPLPKLLLIGEDSGFGLTLTESYSDLDSANYDPLADFSVIPEPLIPYHGRHGRDSNNRYRADHYANASIIAENGGNRIDSDSFYVFYRYAQNGLLSKHSSNLYRKVDKLDVPDHFPKVKIALNRYRSPDGSDNWDTTKDPIHYSNLGSPSVKPMGEEYNLVTTIAYLWTKKVPGSKMRLLCDATRPSGDKWVRYLDYDPANDMNQANLEDLKSPSENNDEYFSYCYEQGERVIGWLIHPDERSSAPFDQFSNADLWKLGRCLKRNGNTDRWIRYYDASTSDSAIKDDDPNECIVLGYALK